jgi:hypothetical protein
VDENERERAAWMKPGIEQEWVRQSIVINGGLIGIGIVMVQPFLTASSLDVAAWICVVAFALAIPLLAGLVLVGEQETFERRLSHSKLVAAAKGVAMLAAFTGIVAGFWHITWVAGVTVIVAGILAMSAHSAGYARLLRPAPGDESDTVAPASGDEA